MDVGSAVAGKGVRVGKKVAVGWAGTEVVVAEAADGGVRVGMRSPEKIAVIVRLGVGV